MRFVFFIEASASAAAPTSLPLFGELRHQLLELLKVEDETVSVAASLAPEVLMRILHEGGLSLEPWITETMSQGNPNTIHWVIVSALSLEPQPRTRSEEEVAGYRDALDLLLVETDPGPFTVPRMLQLHRLLFAHTEATGGRLKDHEDRVVDVLPDGQRVDRFRTVRQRETEFHLRELHDRLEEAWADDRYDRILLTGLYVLDLLVIHPFFTGNGRVARLATTSLLLREGIGVVRYVAVEGLIDRTSDDYYRTLKASTDGWHEAEHDVWPWLGYLTDRFAEAYAELAVEAGAAEHPSKAQRVEDVVLGTQTSIVS